MQPVAVGRGARAPALQVTAGLELLQDGGHDVAVLAGEAVDSDPGVLVERGIDNVQRARYRRWRAFCTLVRLRQEGCCCLSGLGMAMNVGGDATCPRCCILEGTACPTIGLITQRPADEEKKQTNRDARALALAKLGCQWEQVKDTVVGRTPAPAGSSNMLAPGGGMPIELGSLCVDGDGLLLVGCRSPLAGEGWNMGVRDVGGGVAIPAAMLDDGKAGLQSGARVPGVLGQDTDLIIRSTCT